MNNVVGLRGNIPLNEPVPEVVEMLETLLARAKLGEIRGISFAYALPEDIAGTSWSSSAASRNTVAAAISMLQYRFTAQMLGDPS